MQRDVVILGAGLAGLVAANELVARGKTVTILDQEGRQNLGGQAFWSLGGSVSIAPANRHLITDGPYRFIRHPMYGGEILSLFGLCIGSSSLWNWIVLSLFVISVQTRISHEEALFERYPVYAQFVKWRMIPGVW